jgi:putative tricarboxylic transport membrane protein
MSADPLDQTPTAPPPAPQQEPKPWDKYAEALVAVGVSAMGIVILVNTQDIAVPKAYSVVGPRAIPTIVGWALVVLGVWYLIDVLRGNVAAPSGDSEDADPTLPADWGVLLGLALALGIYAIIIKPAGFIIASFVLFSLSSAAMGSRRFVRDAIIGIVMATIAFLVFREWLGIRLPYGVLEGLFS